MRNHVCDKMSCGQILTITGQCLFAATLVPLARSWFGMLSHDDLETSRLGLHVAGWFASVGWLLQRRDAEQWPFKSRPVQTAVSQFVEPAIKTAAPFVLAIFGMLCLIYSALHF